MSRFFSVSKIHWKKIGPDLEPDLSETSDPEFRIRNTRMFSYASQVYLVPQVYCTS
jgi:hypothetical protein